LGHAELIEQATTDPVVAEDARVIRDELLRLRRLANRLLLLASVGSLDFLRAVPIEVDSLMLEALGRWDHVPRAWSLGVLDDATVEADRDHLILAVDALLENAVDHTEV